jgi:hypothetical protein
MRKRTAVAMATGRYSTALACAGEALERLGHPMPTSTFALCAAAAWQCLRQFTHRLQLGLSLGMPLVLTAWVREHAIPVGSGAFISLGHRRA